MSYSFGAYVGYFCLAHLSPLRGTVSLEDRCQEHGLNSFASPIDSRTWGHDDQIFQRDTVYFKRFVSKKKPGFQKLP